MQQTHKIKEHMSKVVSGKALCGDVVNQMIIHELKQKTTPKNKKSNTSNKENVKPTSVSYHHICQPGPSINNMSDSEVSSDESYDENDLCCVCKRHQPIELARSVSLAFVKWVQCVE